MQSETQLEIFPDALTLRRIDPSRNMRRFYRLTVQQDLFGGATLVKEWGRIGLAGKFKTHLYTDEGYALNALSEIAATKIKRGYR